MSYTLCALDYGSDTVIGPFENRAALTEWFEENHPDLDLVRELNCQMHIIDFLDPNEKD